MDCKQKLLHKFKRLRKGVINLTPFQGKLDTIIDDVRDGKLPTKTADTIHKVAHRIVADKNADCRLEDRGIREERLKASVKAMEKIE